MALNYGYAKKMNNSITSELSKIARDMKIIHSFDIEYVDRYSMESPSYAYAYDQYIQNDVQRHVDAVVTLKARAEDMLDVFSFYQNVRPTNNPAVKKAFDEYMLIKALHTESLGGV